MIPFLNYLPLLALTILVEAAIAWQLSKRSTDVLRDLVLLNLVTHPIGTLLVGDHVPWIQVEAMIIVVEALGYRWVTRFSWWSAVQLSVACNVVTAAIGFFFF